MRLKKSTIHRYNYLMVPMLLLAMGCSEEKVATAPPVKVNVVKAIQSDVPLYEEFVSQVYGESDVDLRARVDGWIKKIHYKEGSFVKKGTLLFTIDDLEYQTNVDKEKAKVAEAKTELVRAENDLSRVRPLAEMNALSKKDLDNALAAYEAAKAQVKTAEASLENAKIELGYTRVSAPFDGLVGISNFKEGAYVSRMGNNSILSTISSVGSVRVRFQISEREYLRIARLSKEELNTAKKNLQIILADNTVYAHLGEVNFANRQIDPKTGTMTIEATFPNPEGLLRPGLFVKTRVLMSKVNNAVLVPQKAVFQLQNLAQVYIVTDSSTLKAISVEPGPKTADAWIIKSGLKAGDKIAIIGSASVTPNTKIEEIATAWPADSTKTE